MDALTIPAATLLGLSLVVFAALRGWRDWVDLSRSRLDRDAERQASAGELIELADLRERVRRLEAIAAGVDP